MSSVPGDELVDVVDEQGKTLYAVPRREMRGQRLPHRCTYVLVFNSKGEILIHQRTSTKDVYPSYWDVTVGGVLAAGESFDPGAKREVKEELGVDVDPEPLFPFRYADARSVVQAMVYRAYHEGPFQFQAAEVVQGFFVPRTKLAEWIDREPFCPDGLAVWHEFQKRETAAAQ